MFVPGPGEVPADPGPSLVHRHFGSRRKGDSQRLYEDRLTVGATASPCLIRAPWSLALTRTRRLGSS